MNAATLFTLADQAFLPGVAGLVNSLRSTGFTGTIVLGTPAPIPALDDVPGLRQVVLDDARWIGLLKPTLIRHVATSPFIFLDADIVVADSDFVPRVASVCETGPVLALEGLVAPTDHRRLRWAERMASPPPKPDAWAYYNSGFMAGCLPRDLPLLDAWDDAMKRVLPSGGAHFDDRDFPMPDQDVLNAVLQSSHHPLISIQFPDWWSAVAPLNPFLHMGGLSQTAFLHCTGSKPWTLRAVPPRNPTPYESRWFRHTVLEPGPLRVPCDLPAPVYQWLAGAWSGGILSRVKRIAQRVTGR